MHQKKRGLTGVVASKCTRAITASMLLGGLFLSCSAMASQESDDTTLWFINLLKANDGRAFCLPPTMTLKGATALLQNYSKAHPELHDEITDPVAIQAIASAYPCGAAHPAAQAVEATPAGEPKQIQVTPQGDYASIDTRLAAETIRRLQETSGSENDAVIAEVEKNSGNYAPPVLFELANLLYMRHKFDDAIFWFNAANLRARFDAARCADVSARSAVPDLLAQVPIEFRRSQLDDPRKLKDIVGRVVRWDENTPYNYDNRWINLHGMDAIGSGLGNADTANKPLSLPREQWSALAQQTRADYVHGIDAAIADHEGQNASN